MKKHVNREIFFYEAVHRAAEEHTGEIGAKLRKFYRQVERFREMIPYTPIHELLWRILEETGYGLYISAMPGGEQRAANVEMLVEKAAVFEGTSYKGLFHFVRYIEQLRKYDVDYGEANIADEQADTVRIMSIHKSKGLEFSGRVCGRMGKRFNMIGHHRKSDHPSGVGRGDRYGRSGKEDEDPDTSGKK